MSDIAMLLKLALPADGRTHCSSCRRKLRPKILSRSFAGVTYDWLNHLKHCPRYGQAPDA